MVWICVHVVPFQVHVSFKAEGAPALPPNITTLPTIGSYAIAGSPRGEGLVAGNCSVQVVPSQVHVWFMLPPKRTTSPLAASYAIVALLGGGLVDGNFCVQVFARPFQIQVSARLGLQFPPINITTFSVAWSYTIPCVSNSQARGETGGNCWVHVTPSQVHVSFT